MWHFFSKGTVVGKGTVAGNIWQLARKYKHSLIYAIVLTLPVESVWKRKGMIMTGSWSQKSLT